MTLYARERGTHFLSKFRFPRCQSVRSNSILRRKSDLFHVLFRGEGSPKEDVSVARMKEVEAALEKKETKKVRLSSPIRAMAHEAHHLVFKNLQRFHIRWPLTSRNLPYAVLFLQEQPSFEYSGKLAAETNKVKGKYSYFISTSCPGDYLSDYCE